MARPRRVVAGGLCYHVLNRANARMTLFEHGGDYEAFEVVLDDAVKRVDMRLLAYCVLPNHWHLVVWPRNDGDLSTFVGWLTLTHTQRWHAYHGTAGNGHVYQGRFKSFIMESDTHLLTVCRYVERNALRAGLVSQAERWRWSSAWRVRFGEPDAKALVTDWPVPRPGNWWTRLNRPETLGELKALRQCIARAQPFGTPEWVARMIDRFDLESHFRSRGRPRISRP